MAADKIEDALKDVIDPELGVNIVDLGLVYEITPSEDDVHVLMTLTSPGCPLHQYFRDTVATTVAEQGDWGPEDVEVEFTFDPPWSREKMSDEAKAELNMI